MLLPSLKRTSSSRAYVSENTTHYYMPDWAYLEQNSGHNTVKEWSEHKIKAILLLSTLENPYIDSLFGLLYELWLFDFFGVICLIRRWVVIYATELKLQSYKLCRSVDMMAFPREFLETIPKKQSFNNGFSLSLFCKLLFLKANHQKFSPWLSGQHHYVDRGC